MKVKLADQSMDIAAPRELVFQMLSAFGKGSLPGAEGESSRVVERDGNVILAEFLSVSGNRTYRTLENVVLYPPERITFEHVEGPLPFSEEEFTLAEREAGTRLAYVGKIECKISWMPGMGWLIALLYARPKYNSVIRNHMKRLKSAAEARALRSHVFRRPQQAQNRDVDRG